jgi:glycosyltransferase involved in cell wall biosynthesis
MIPLLRIGYVLTTFPALPETFVLDEILELERQGVEIVIFSLRSPRSEPRHESLARLKARIFYLRERDPELQLSVREFTRAALTITGAIATGHLSEIRNIRRGAQIAAGARRLGLTGLHAHFADRPASLAYWGSRLAGLSFSFTAHARDIFEHARTDRLMARKYQAARFVVTVTAYNKRYLDQEYGEAVARKIHMLYNGVDLDYFAFRGDAGREPNSVISVGRLVAKKGFDLLVRACARLRERGLNVRCTIIGEGPERGALEALAQSLSIKDRVSFAGALSQAQVRERLYKSAVFCLPCRESPTGDRDALPAVLLEAMACGVPVVSTRYSGIPEGVQDGKNGLLVGTEDVDGLTDALASLLASSDLRQRLAQAARQTVEQCFALRTKAARLKELLSQR